MYDQHLRFDMIDCLENTDYGKVYNIGKRAEVTLAHSELELNVSFKNYWGKTSIVLNPL